LREEQTEEDFRVNRTEYRQTLEIRQDGDPQTPLIFVEDHPPPQHVTYAGVSCLYRADDLVYPVEVTHFVFRAHLDSRLRYRPQARDIPLVSTVREGLRY